MNKGRRRLARSSGCGEPRHAGRKSRARVRTPDGLLLALLRFFVPPGSIAPTGGWVNAKSDFRRCANCRGGVSGAATRIAVRWTSSRSHAKSPSPELDARPADRQLMAPASTRSEIGPGRFDLPQIQEFLPARQAGLGARSRSPATSVAAVASALRRRPHISKSGVCRLPAANLWGIRIAAAGAADGLARRRGDVLLSARRPAI